MIGTHCAACGHQHTSDHWAYICIGCPCPHYPAGVDDDGRPFGCGEDGEPWPCSTFRGSDLAEASAALAKIEGCEHGFAYKPNCRNPVPSHPPANVAIEADHSRPLIPGHLSDQEVRE